MVRCWVNRWKWVDQQLGYVADIVQPCQQPSYWSLAAATCPPIGQLCVVSMELWGRHMGHHCMVDKIVSYLGPDFPLFHASYTRRISADTSLAVIIRNQSRAHGAIPDTTLNRYVQCGSWDYYALIDINFRYKCIKVLGIEFLNH